MLKPLQLGIEGTKWDIVYASVNLFAENGYSNVSMKDIAKQVGIRSSSIYNYFVSKDELLDTIYGFLRQHLAAILPNLEKLLALAATQPPRTVLRMTYTNYHPDIQDMMMKILIIAMAQMRHDTRADSLIRWVFIDNSTKYLSALLNRMVELNRIRPIDVEAFIEVHTGYNYSAVARMFSGHPINNDVWENGLNMIFNMVQPVE